MAFWRATDVDLPQNSAIVTVNTGDDVGSITSGYIIQINAGQFLEVKTVNTGASPQTIELYQIYTGTAITGGTAIAAPTQGAIKEATEELRNLRTTYETLADSVSSTATANSVVKRNGSAQVLVADATANNHAMAFGQYTDPTDYGLGAINNLPVGANLDNLTDTAFFTGFGGANYDASTGDNPYPDLNNAFSLIVQKGVNVNAGEYITQIAINYSSTLNTIRFRSKGTDSAGGWTPWRDLYHSGNSVNPVDYGIGIYYNENTALKNQSNEDDLPSGLYTAYSPNNANASIGDAPKPTDAGAYSLLNIQGVSSDARYYTTQLATLYDPNITSMYFRTRATAGFGDWNEVYHSKNTNFNEFGGVADNDVLAVGYAFSTTGVSFYLPINSNTAPTGITTVGTFSIKLPAAASDTANNVTLALSPASSNKLLAFTVTGLTGLTTNHTYVLQAESATSKITVNF